MYSYSIFTLLAFIVFPFQNGNASDCKTIKENLFALEHKYQTEHLDQCTKNTKTRYCANDESTSKTIYQAQLDYNKALAKVNMLEGLIAISASVENSHNAMKKVDVTDLDKAKGSIDKFLKNYTLANVLNKSMQPNTDGSYIWEGYKGDNYQSTYNHIMNKCETGKFKNFCEILKLKIDDPEYSVSEIFETLHGFAQADIKGKSNYQPQLRDDNYNEYRKYLQFSSSESTKPQDLSNLEKSSKNKPSEIQKVYDLKRLVTEYEKNADKKTGKDIVSLANQLQDIQMNFGNINIQNPLVKGFINDKFSKNLTSISAAAGILNGEENIKNNFKTVKKSLHIELDGKEKTLLKNAAKLKGKLPSSCSLKSATSLGKCLKLVCGNDLPKKCIQSADNKELFRKGLGDIYDDYINFHEAEILKDANSAMLECMDSQVVNNYTDAIYKKKSTTEKKQICLDENKEKISYLLDKDDLKSAKEELSNAQNNLDFINHGDKIKDILAEKYITIKMLKSNHCIGDKSKQSAGYLSSYCNTENLNTHTKTALKLSTDVGDALLKYKLSEYQSFLNGKGYFNKDKNGETSYEKMVRQCQENKNASSVCPYFISEEKDRKEQKRIREKLIKRKHSVYADDSYFYGDYVIDEEDKGPSSFAYAMGGLATGVVKNMPGIFSYFQTRKMHKNQMQMWDNQINYHNYYWGAGATQHTNNIIVNYDDWYANQNTFNPTGYKYFNPSSSLYFPNFAPSSLGSPNSSLYTPASNTSSGFNFN